MWGHIQAVLPERMMSEIQLPIEARPRLFDFLYRRPLRIAGTYDHMVDAGHLLAASFLHGAVLAGCSSFSLSAAAITIPVCALYIAYKVYEARPSHYPEIRTLVLDEVKARLEARMVEAEIPGRVKFLDIQTLTGGNPLKHHMVASLPPQKDPSGEWVYHVGLTPGALKTYTADELEALSCHEITHPQTASGSLRRGMNALSVIYGVGMLASEQYLAAAILWFFQNAINITWRRSDEYRCDRGSAVISRNPKAMISAAVKMDNDMYSLADKLGMEVREHPSYPRHSRRIRRLGVMHRQLGHLKA